MIILGGDSLSHPSKYLEESLMSNRTAIINESERIFEIIKNKIKEKLNNTNILFVPGNNDFYERYNTPDKDSLELQTKIIEKIFMSEFQQENKEKFNEDYQNTILNGFYYTYDLNEKTRIIVINSILFSIKNENIDENDIENSANKHLIWMENQILKAEKKNKKVILLGHIPPFINRINNEMEYLFKKAFSKLIKELLYKYRNNIIYFFSSHCHLPRIAVRFNIEKTDKIIKCKNFSLENKNDMSKGINYMKNFLEKDTAIYSDIQNSFLTFVKFSEFNNNKRNSILNNFEPNPQISFYSSFILFPSLSPVYLNNPGYSIVEFDNEKNLLENVEHRFFNMKQAENITNFMVEYNKKHNSDKDNKEEDLIKNIIFDNSQFEYKNISNKPVLEDANFYKKLLLKNLWNNKYNYRDDFKFKNFSPEDFAIFIFSTLYDENYLKKFYTFMLGYNTNEYETAKKIILENGIIDENNNLKGFREIFYKFDENDCDMLE